MAWRPPHALIVPLAGAAVAALSAFAAAADPPARPPPAPPAGQAARAPEPSVRRPPGHVAEPAVRHGGHPAAPARSYRRTGCVSQRGMIAVVQAHRAVPLTAIRGEAERRGNGELIGARLCHRDGRLVYFVSVLSERGKVVHLAFDAATGRMITAAR